MWFSSKFIISKIPSEVLLPSCLEQRICRCERDLEICFKDEKEFKRQGQCRKYKVPKERITWGVSRERAGGEEEGL